jgi:hypothetical protein
MAMSSLGEMGRIAEVERGDQSGLKLKMAAASG